jgi:NADPH-dependent 2,4-dienoyl-CoA reductase/sulfur reductase-like enzyme
MQGPKTPPQQLDFHQTLVRLTTRRTGDIAPVTEKGWLKFLYVPRNEHEHMDIVIIGGGIGGLTLALALHLRGIPCRVYESAPEVKELGVGIDR